MTLCFESAEKGNSSGLDSSVSLSLSSFLLPDRKEESKEGISAFLPMIIGLQRYCPHAWK